MTDGPTTRIACSDADSVTIRGENLVDDLIGKKTFTEMVYFLTRGRHPSSTETAILDACLVTLMEHGFTPPALFTRIPSDSVPDQFQVSLPSFLLSFRIFFFWSFSFFSSILALFIYSPVAFAFFPFFSSFFFFSFFSLF